MDSANYGDFGSDDSESDSDSGGKMDCLDSDEEERIENEALLKLMTSIPHAKTKKDREITDFEAEMEAELDRRALQIESQGGVEHQKKKLNRSSSNSSLQNLSLSPAPGPSTSQPSTSSSMRGRKQESIASGESRKSVRFAADESHQETSKVLEASASGAVNSASGSGPNGKSEPATTVYDQIYFDSDESEGEDEETKKSRRQKRNLVSNDDLLYDPESDAKDQEWIDKRRRKYYASTNPTSSAGVPASDSSSGAAKKNQAAPKPLPNSDAVLNCPACFSTLCLDCQRHDFYTGQYRAMFVMNCTINRQESLRVPLKAKGKGKKHAAVPATPIFQSDSNDLFNPVKCKICNTQVAVFDTDEVYHFFNVLASHS